MKNKTDFERYGVYLIDNHYWTLIGCWEINMYGPTVTSANRWIALPLAMLKRKWYTLKIRIGGRP